MHLISVYVLERSQTVRTPRAEVFEFFAEAANLERLTPPFLGFNILTALPIEMRVGALIDYKIRLHGVPMKWKTRIAEYQPDDHFVDEQLAGPYKRWHHLHTFADAPGGGTVIGDRVTYQLPFGPLGRLVHTLFVRRQLRTIFDYRAQIMADRFGA